MLFGSNIGAYSRVNSATGGMTAVRIYRRDWTPMVAADFPGGLVPIVSVADLPLAPVIAGQQDAEIAAWMASLPAGTLAAFGHELNGAKWNVNPNDLAVAVSRLRQLAQAHGNDVTVGAVYSMWPLIHAGQDFDPWAHVDADWYGLDGYQELVSDTVTGVFDLAFSTIRAHGRTPVLITETNSAVDADAWMRAVLGYVQHRTYAGLLLFANGNPTFPNLPTAATLEAAARQCAVESVR